MRIGYFKHWFQPQYSFITFLREEMKLDVVEINFRKPGYLDDIDVAIIEQNGFNDFIENDELYFREFVHRGGICLFMHQDYRRWAKYFLPEGIGYPILVDRYINTITYMGGGIAKSYMMPIIEPAGEALFSIPEKINPEDMLYWKLQANSFDIVGLANKDRVPETVMTAATSCAVNCQGWEILGSYQDAVVTDGALVLQARYGKGLYFMNQILFPETLDGTSEAVFSFWRKYVKNLLAHFERHMKGEQAVLPPKPAKKLAKKRNYRTAIHLHALEWYGADNSLGVIQALMRHQKYDIATIAIKDAIPYGGKLDLERYSDDKVLLLHGQEYHPFQWTEMNAVCGTHNAYHSLAMGIDDDAYTPEFTRSLFSTEEAMAFVKNAIDFVHSHGGAICATHPYFDYWKDFDYDGVDHEPIIPLAGTDYEKAYMTGKRIAIMNSVDMWGVQRLLDNQAANFIYIDGDVNRDSFVAAVKAGHVIASCYILEADITLDDAIPGDEVKLGDAQKGTVKVHAKGVEGVKCVQVRVYSADKLIACVDVDDNAIDVEVPLAGKCLDKFVRVEVEGEHLGEMTKAKKTFKPLALSTPFYLV